MNTNLNIILEEVFRWIPVEERLPKAKEKPYHILIANEKNMLLSVYAIRDETCIIWIKEHFTHWRPIDKEDFELNKNMNEFKGVNVRYGTSYAADFEENTWAFLMEENYQVSAGDFAILPKSQFEDLISKASGKEELSMSTLR